MRTGRLGYARQVLAIGGFLIGVGAFGFALRGWIGPTDLSPKRTVAATVDAEPVTILVSKSGAGPSEDDQRRKEFRRSSGLRQLNETEHRMDLDVLPKGTYGFVYAMDFADHDGAVLRSPVGTYFYEVHKHLDGRVYYFGYVSPAHQSVLDSGVAGTVLVFSRPRTTASHLIRIESTRISWHQISPAVAGRLIRGGRAS